MSGVRYNLGSQPEHIPQQDALLAANKLNEQRYLKLTNKQRVFLDCYLANNFDATKAALEVGYAEEEAARVGRKILKRAEMQEAIQLALAYHSEATKLRVETLIEELKIIALTPLTDVVDPDTAEIRPEIDTDSDLRMRIIKKIKVTETKYGTNREIEAYDRMAAIDKLIKILQPSLLPDEGAGSGGTTNNTTSNVTNHVTQMVAIVPVPSGQFLPAPPSPYEVEMPTIDGSVAPVPTGALVMPRSLATVERDD
jgi:phage terminase small subunit